LVNIKLRNRISDEENKKHITLKTENTKINKFPQRRSPDEFQIYLRELFESESQNFRYHWYFSTRKKRKGQYCRIDD
jgi:hypothetical protein